jgi:hypothetical protein
MTVLFQESTTVETQPSAISELVYATFKSPDRDFSCFVNLAKLKKAKSVNEARTILFEQGYNAVTQAGLDLLLEAERKYLNDEHLLEDPQAGTAENLVRDARGYDGFVYRYGEDTPLSTPISGFICASSTKMTPELLMAIIDHPYTITSGETHYVPGNGASLDFQILFPQEVFDKIYLDLRSRGEKYFSIESLWRQIVGRYDVKSRKFDLLGIHQLIEEPTDWEY